MTAFDIQDLLRPEAYPHAVHRIELVETHISWILLTGSHAYKVKKPVRFDFVDASTLELRRRLCEEELRLNRRLAPQLYLDLSPIGSTAEGLRVDHADSPIEWAVRMRQFDRGLELSSLLRCGEPTAAEMEALAALLARFHAQAACSSNALPYGTAAQATEVILANLRGLDAAVGSAAEHRELARIGEWIRAETIARRELMDARHAAGRVRECHGDLHARNIVRWEGRLLPFDCLEFAPALRWSDVASELAFLHMDLLAHGRGDLAATLLSAYLEVSGDYDLLRLLRLYGVHRALVRARVDLLQARSSPEAAASELRERAASRLEVAERLALRGVPFLVLMHGPSGSGKSWLSRRLAPALEAVHVRSDVERKRLAGLDALERSGSAVESGLYSAGETARTYARLLECAASALEGGLSAIVDATSLRRSQREPFLRLARALRHRFLIVSCAAERDVLRTRIRVRESSRRDPSEATLEVLDRQLAGAEPLSPAELEHTVQLDTARCTEHELIDIVRVRLGQRG